MSDGSSYTDGEVTDDEWGAGGCGSDGSNSQISHDERAGSSNTAGEMGSAGKVDGSNDKDCDGGSSNNGGICGDAGTQAGASNVRPRRLSAGQYSRAGGKGHRLKWGDATHGLLQSLTFPTGQFWQIDHCGASKKLRIPCLRECPKQGTCLRHVAPRDMIDCLAVSYGGCLAWLEEAAKDPQAAIDGTLSLRASLEAGKQRVAPLKDTANARRKAERAQLDLDRIRGVLATDPEVRELVHEMLKAAFTSMAESTRNHAAEYLPGGPCCSANITPELRKAMDGTPTTSVMAETMFARIKRRAERGGAARHDTRIGLTMCDRDKTVDWLASKGGKAQAIYNLARKTWRQGSGKLTVQGERRIKGEAIRRRSARPSWARSGTSAAREQPSSSASRPSRWPRSTPS
mmetsp:Transcript_26648/g.86078  ORF Transcript_26648/g.86078 Transcript_26648/m.86078 type:complete len:402 (+) Transcript_26648:268-1473(+)